MNMKNCYILEMKSFCAACEDSLSEYTFDVFQTLEEAQKAMKRRAKARLKILPAGWEKAYEHEDKLRLECESNFFDKHVTWTIHKGKRNS
jgi:hypothetical protein